MRGVDAQGGMQGRSRGHAGIVLDYWGIIVLSCCSCCDAWDTHLTRVLRKSVCQKVGKFVLPVVSASGAIWPQDFVKQSNDVCHKSNADLAVTSALRVG
eukprot:1195934-Prorocentrum_minimum.AAC.4